MRGTMDKFDTAEAYFAAIARDDFRAALLAIRDRIYQLAPEAIEDIGYGMPTYKVGKGRVYLAAFKNHCSLFPGGIALDFQDALPDHKISKGTIQFSPENPIPNAVLDTILRRALLL